MTSLGRVIVLIGELEDEGLDAANSCRSADQHRVLDFPSADAGDSALGPTLALVRELQEALSLLPVAGMASGANEMARHCTGNR